MAASLSACTVSKPQDGEWYLLELIRGAEILSVEILRQADEEGIGNRNGKGLLEWPRAYDDSEDDKMRSFAAQVGCRWAAAGQERGSGVQGPLGF